MYKGTLKNNKLIAEFMGVLTPENNIKSNEITLCVYELTALEQSHYHHSWDWLMPVVEKIESLKCHIIISSKGCSMDYCHVDKNDNVYKITPITNGYLESNFKIDSVYKAAVKFIEWYNENKLK